MKPRSIWPSDARDPSGHLIRELHGITLAQILDYLVEHLGWESLAEQIRINCFALNPSAKSSLVFLRRTPWARTKVEQLYVEVRTEEVMAAADKAAAAQSVASADQAAGPSSRAAEPVPPATSAGESAPSSPPELGASVARERAPRPKPGGKLSGAAKSSPSRKSPRTGPSKTPSHSGAPAKKHKPFRP